MDARDDETLLRAYAQQIDEAAFRQLALRYGGLVYAACLRDLRRPELAEDAAQEVFLVLARKAGRIRIRTTLVPWLIGTARLVSRGVLRAERRRPTSPLEDSLPANSQDSDETLFQALDALSAPDREAVVLRFVQGMSLAEVGRAQGVSEDAARMRVSRALKRLRSEYVPALAAPLSLSKRLAFLPLPKPSPLMTTPFLASGSVAALVVAGFVTKVHPFVPAASAAPVLENPIGAQAKVLDESKLKPAKPGPPPPEIVTLDKPFTLVYRLTITDLRTKAMKEAAIAEEMKSLAKEVDEDRKTQAQADEEIARLRAPSQARTETITLAYDGKTLLYVDHAESGDDPRPAISLFNGKHSYYFAPKVATSKYASQGAREEGTVQYWTWNMPYVGPSVPFFPVIRGKEILLLSAYDKKPVYRPFGSVVPGPKGTVGKLLTGRFDPQDTVELSSWKPLHGTVVAGSVVRTKRAYWPYLTDGDMGKPEKRYEYTLISASPSADPARFSPDSYTEDGMLFRLNGGRKELTLDRTKGSLEQQIATIMGAGS